MPKKPSARTLMNSEHVKVSKTLHESALQYFFHIFDHSARKYAPKILFQWYLKSPDCVLTY